MLVCKGIFKGPGLDNFAIDFTGDKHGILVYDQFFRASSKSTETTVDRLTYLLWVIFALLCIDA